MVSLTILKNNVVPHEALAKGGYIFNKMHYVYLLQLTNGSYYTGRTDNLKRRLKEHTSGQERTTKNFLPCILITYIAFTFRSKAVKFEKYLKTGSGFAFRNRHLI